MIKNKIFLKNSFLLPKFGLENKKTIAIMMPVLKEIEPTALPNAIWGIFSNDEVMEIIASGRVVQILTKVAPITKSGILNVLAIQIDISTNTSLHFRTRIKPIANKMYTTAIFPKINTPIFCVTLL